MTDLDSVKRQLEEQLQTLTAKVDEIETELRASHSADWEEQAIERESDDMLESLEESTRTEIIAIRGALSKIEAGTYGVCEVCGATIDPKRIDALPYATQCVKCAA